MKSPTPLSRPVCFVFSPKSVVFRHQLQTLPEYFQRVRKERAGCSIPHAPRKEVSFSVTSAVCSASSSRDSLSLKELLALGVTTTPQFNHFDLENGTQKRHGNAFNCEGYEHFEVEPCALFSSRAGSAQER